MILQLKMKLTSITHNKVQNKICANYNKLILKRDMKLMCKTYFKMISKFRIKISYYSIKNLKMFFTHTKINIKL